VSKYDDNTDEDYETTNDATHLQLKFQFRAALLKALDFRRLLLQLPRRGLS